MVKNFDVIIIGGGAAGFFSAINIAEQNPRLSVAILERGQEVLSKVRISGGGRCNVTHSCFDIERLVEFYPRGGKELRSAFHQFSCINTIEWFKNHGVELKTESDGRIFPTSNSSSTIVNCFLKYSEKFKIQVLKEENLQSVLKESIGWKIQTTKNIYTSPKLIFATGNNPKIWKLLQQLGHTIINPVPSLFTFKIKDPRINDLPGISVSASIRIKNTKISASGALLITHWGMSGPSVLKLSSIGARILAEKDYKFSIQVNFLNNSNESEVEYLFIELKNKEGKKLVFQKSPIVAIPNRLWNNIAIASGIDSQCRWGDLSKIQLQKLSNQLVCAEFVVDGKNTFKDEFVTAGGVDLKEVNFKSMESKLHQNLYFAGEVLNIDAFTGGFNFQNAWTGAFIAANFISNYK